MYPEIVEMKPLTVVGFTSRHKMPNVRFTHDIPLYWETINMDYGNPSPDFITFSTNPGIARLLYASISIR